MVAINLVAILGLAAMLAMYFPLCSFLRGRLAAVGTSPNRLEKKRNKQQKGKKAVGTVSVSSISEAQEKNIGLTVFVAVMALAFLVRIIVAAMYKGHDTDMNCFLLWGDMVYQDGFKEFYLSPEFHDYPPGYMYILYVIGWLRSIFHISWDSVVSIVMTKTPAILADLGVGYLIYKAASKRFKESGAALLSAAYLFCPAVFLDSAVWGQTDGVFTFFVVLMCYLITGKRLIPSYFVFAVAILIKPQSLIFTPVLIFGIIDQVFLEDFNWMKFWKNLGLGLLAIAMIGLLMMPYGFQEALAQYKDTVGSYEYASVNAYNFWTLCGLNWASQDGIKFGLSYQTWGTVFIVLTVAAAAFISFRCKKTESKYYYLGAFIVTCVFLFSVRMHERYIFPAMALLVMAYALRPRRDLYLLYSFISFYGFYNIAHVLFVFDGANYDPLEPVMLAISFLGILVFGFLVYVTIRYYGHYVEEKQETEAVLRQTALAGRKESTEKSVIRPSSILVKMTKADYISMGVITLVYAIVAFVHLGNLSAPQTEYSVVAQGAVVADLGQDTYVAKLNNFLGYQNNPKYYLDYSSDNVNWTPLYGAENPLDAGGVFCWNSADVNVTARYFRLSPAADNGGDSLMELVFTDAEGNVITPVNAGDYATLFDEQDLYQGRATHLNGTYFDEIYHARTAYEMIHKLYCYENTHPPLGKIFIAIGVMIFGMCPFGWRFMGTLFGVLMLPVIYHFGKKFFKETWISSIVTILFAFDFMHFVQTRIATIDVFVTLFIILSYYFMYCYSRMSFYDTKLTKTFIPLGLCGIAMGLGWASKWTGIYSSAGLAIIFFAQMIQRFREYVYASKNPEGKSGEIEHQYILNHFHKHLIRTILFCCVFFVLIPAAIYMMSYIPFNDGTDRGLIQRVIAAQKTMFDYHSQLDATHPYSSTWWQWPIMYRPMWYYSGIVSDTVREGISSFGNPLVWWAGIPAFAFMLYRMLVKKDRKAAFLTVGYLSQYAPWFLVTRVVFIYHYFPSVPFITIMLGYSMVLLVKRFPSCKKWMFVYTALAVVLFVMFYPVLSGTPTTISYAEHWLKWFDNWVLLQTW